MTFMFKDIHKDLLEYFQDPSFSISRHNKDTKSF